MNYRSCSQMRQKSVGNGYKDLENLGTNISKYRALRKISIYFNFSPLFLCQFLHNFIKKNPYSI